MAMNIDKKSIKRFFITSNEPLPAKKVAQESCEQAVDSTENENADEYVSIFPSTSAAFLEDSDAVSMTNSPVQRKTFHQKFRSTWKETYKWLESKEGKSYCKVCQKFLANNITNIDRHEKSNNHMKCEKDLAQQIRIDDTETIKNFRSKTRQVKTIELKLIVFLCLYNLPLSLITPLMDLIKNICYDVNIVKELKCGRTKATETVNDILAENFLESLAGTLRETKFAIIIDESTDVSASKCLGLVVRYFDCKAEKIRDRFLGLIELGASDAQSIYSALVDVFLKIKVPLENLVGFAADNASTMMGNLNGVQSLLKNVNKHLYVSRCICHSLSLCSSAASKELPTELEQLVRDIYTFFVHSSKRQNAYKEFQEYFDVKQHKILKLANTRWLSLESAVARILEQWVALKHYFIINDFEENSDLASCILSRMTDKNFCYLQFLLYALNAVNKLNLEFQSESPRFHVLLRTLTLYFKNIVSNFIDLKSTSFDLICETDLNNCNFKQLVDIYIGPKAQMTMEQCDLCLEDKMDIRKHCLNFYIVLAKQILKRVNFKDPVLKAVEILDPAMLGSSLVPLIQLFPNLVKENQIEELENEWRLLTLNDFLQNEKNVEIFWISVFKFKNGLGNLLQLKQFVGALLCLPHSSATTERVFSQMKLIKSKTRNKLKVDTVNSLMLIKEYISEDTLLQWYPSEQLLQNYHKSLAE